VATCLVSVQALLGVTSLAAANLFGNDVLPELPPTRYRYICLAVGCVYALFFLLPVGAGPCWYRSVPHPILRGCACYRCLCRSQPAELMEVGEERREARVSVPPDRA
jgi:hypothetical protein